MNIEVRVRYSETDQMGVVHHSNYFHWFEMGRTELLRELGLSYKEFEESGFLMPVVEAHCKYIHPARYDEVLIIKTEIKEKTPVTITMKYEIVKKSDSQTLVKGWTKHTFLNEDGKVVKLPPNFLKFLEKYDT